MVGLVLFGILSYATIINGDDLDVTTNVINEIGDLLTGSSPSVPPVDDTSGDLIDVTVKVGLPTDIITTTTDNPNDNTMAVSYPPVLPIEGTTGGLIDAKIKVDLFPDIIPTTTDNSGDTSTTGSSIPILPISTTTDPIIGPIITSIPILSTNNNNSPGLAIPINPRAYYGSGTCCPQLTPLPAPIGKVSLSHVTIVVH